MKPLAVAATFALVLAAVAFWQWDTAQTLRRENDGLRRRLEAAHSDAAAATAGSEQKLTAELEKSRIEAQELARLRSEVTSLRETSKAYNTLRARQEQLQAENQRLRSGSAQAGVAAGSPSPAQAATDTFNRDAWSFAGYASPESALVSAIWAMREGNPKTYLDSLSPDEQSRMSQVWGGKSESEVAAKHQADVSKITSIRVVDKQDVSPDQVTMSVYIGGVDRLEKVSMQRVGNDWKFGGFLRDPKK